MTYTWGEIAEITCDEIGQESHQRCGWCLEHDRPTFRCHAEGLNDTGVMFTLGMLVKKIGMGFNPDTPGHAYTSLPEGINSYLYDDLLGRDHIAMEAHRRAHEWFEIFGWITSDFPED